MDPLTLRRIRNSRTMRTAFKLTLLLPLLLTLPVHATVFKCIGSDGSVTYTNERSPGANCSRLDENLPVSSIPAPQRQTSTPTPATTPPAAGFPRVSPDAQRSRDDTRRQILENELDAEQQALGVANTALAEQLAAGGGDAGQLSVPLQPYRDQIELHERNIEALQREIRGLR